MSQAQRDALFGVLRPMLDSQGFNAIGRIEAVNAAVAAFEAAVRGAEVGAGQAERDALFDVLRPMLDSRKFNIPARIEAIDDAIDGIEDAVRAAAGEGPGLVGTASPIAAAPHSAVAPAAVHAEWLPSLDAFFDAIRPSVRFSSMSSAQAASIAADLAEMAELGFPISWAAYVLGTEYHETGGKMLPNVESLNYRVAGLLGNFGRHRIGAADAQRLGRKPGEAPLSLERQEAIGNLIYGGEYGRRSLGNTQPGDGFKYRGRGKDHCTGRANYAKVDEALGLGGRLLANPDLLLQADYASKAIVSGMKLGRYTGHKLADHLPTDRAATLPEFTGSRPIINGTDRASDIAVHASFFQRALQAGGCK